MSAWSARQTRLFGIVYCARCAVQSITELLQNAGHNVRAYHGRLRAGEK